MNKKKISIPSAQPAVTIPKPKPSEKRLTPTSGFTFWITPAFFFLASILLYSNTFKHRFVLDDHGIIKNNKITKAPISVENTVKIFSTPLRKGDVSDLENSLYRPVVKLLFNIEWNLFDGNPYAFHITNVLLYALTCGVIFLVLYEVFQKKWTLPFLITLLFMVHPIHVETVANVKSGDEVLSLLGIVTALRCIQLYFAREKKYFLFLAIISFLLGSFSKESTIIALAIFPLFMYYYTKASVKQNAIISAIMLACSLFFLICRHLSLSGYPEPTPLSAMDNYLVECTNGASRFASAVNTLGLYLKTIFIPHPLSCDYSYSSLQPVTMSNPYFLLSFAIFASLLVWAIIKFKTKQHLVFGICWFFISVSIVSNIFFLIGTSFGERLMFTPSLGAVMGAVVLLAHFFHKSNNEGKGIFQEIKGSPILFGVVFITAALYSVKTYSRNENWKTDFKLFSRDIEYYPESTHLLFYMGNHLSGNERKEVLNYEMTELGYTPKQIADSSAIENVKSVEYFNRSLSIFPALPSDGYNQLGKAYYNMGELDSAQKYYIMAFDRDTTNGIFINNCGTVFYQWASRDVTRINNYSAMGKIDSANYLLNLRIYNVVKSRGYFIKANKKDPTEPDFTNNIACTYGDLGVYDSAVYWFKKSVELDPIDTTALKFLELTFRSIKDEANASFYHQKYLDARAEHYDVLSASQN